MSLRRTPADTRQQIAALGLVDQRHQSIADFQSDDVDRLHVIPREFLGLRRRRRRSCSGRRCGHFFFGRLLLGALVEHVSTATAERRHHQERQVRHARDDAHDAEQARSDRQRTRLTEQLLRQLAAHVLRTRDARHNDRDGGREQQRRNLRHQTVTDGEQRVHTSRVAEATCRAAIMPMARPPNILMNRIRMPAVASPRTNLLAPSIEP